MNRAGELAGKVGTFASNAGKKYKSFNKVLKNVHAASGGAHGTQTNISGMLAGDYKGKTAELNTVVNLMAKVLNAKTSGELTTAQNNLNSNSDFQEFVKNKTEAEKTEFMNQLVALAQLQTS